MLVGDLGEEALLKELRSLFSANLPPGVLAGIGDDAAIVDFPPGAKAVLTTDLLLEGIHFKRDWQTADQLGSKCLVVNLSDLAAMGATPHFALLSISCPDDTGLDFIREFCQGLQALAEEFGVSVIGGDTTASSSGIIVSITAIGSVSAQHAVLRSGAQAGDFILVTGHLGDAAAGLRMIEADRRQASPRLVDAFLQPQARLKAAKAAAEAGATAMTDISDGLASDLRHICEESGMGALIRTELLPVSSELSELSSRMGWDIEKMILTGGEDYELLFTMPPVMVDPVKAVIAAVESIPVTVIGEVMPCEFGIQLADPDGGQRPMPVHGFDHFLRHE